MKRLSWIAFVALLAMGPAMLAHGVKGPHGGQMLLVGTHNFEIVVGASDFSIYVMNMKKAVLPLTGISGSAEIHSNNDKKTDNVPLTVEKDHLVGKMALKTLGKAEIHAKLMVDGKQATVAFEYPFDFAEAATAEHAHK